jgi:hypothetical protein
MTAVFLRYVHGRTVPVALRAVVARAYLPAAAGLTVIAAVASIVQGAAGQGVMTFACIGLATIIALAWYAAAVIAAPADRARIRAIWPVKRASGG